MILVDGKKIANDILATVAERILLLPRKPTLLVITCDPNFETEKYLALKKNKASTLGSTTTATCSYRHKSSRFFNPCQS
jgi:5,10-methylene-tetrahydrofolate dehydrogenase/methenyl tetrahydrofolate cyclohydrolase